MTTTLRLIAAAAALLVQFGIVTACAQQYPAKIVRIVASEAGGGGDFVARILAQGLTASFDQKFVVENRGGGVIAGDVVARSAPDGHTLLLYGNTLWLLPLMRRHVPYDPARDFVPVSLATRGIIMLLVHPSLPVKSVSELIALARAHPGKLNYASAAPGTSSHMGAELFKYLAEVEIVRVSFRGAASALNSVLGGEVHIIFTTAAGAAMQVREGKLRALAVTSREPSSVFPGVPTVVSAGLPELEVAFLMGVFAPAGTPHVIVARLSQEIARVLQRPEVRDRLDRVGYEPVGSSPEAMAAVIKDEVTRMEKVIRTAGIREE